MSTTIRNRFASLLVAFVATCIVVGCQPAPVRSVNAEKPDVTDVARISTDVDSGSQEHSDHLSHGHDAEHADHDVDGRNHDDDSDQAHDEDEHEGHDDDTEHSMSESPTSDTPAIPHAAIADSTPPSTEPLPVELGLPELTAGIPGEGNLTTKEIEAWLNHPNVHRPLDVQLPMGLAAASGNITGIDENPMTLAKIELGRQLYFDTRLSADATVSCASCHHPDEGYAKRTQFGVGIEGQEGNRNSPASYNRIVSGAQFWDGRAASLEEQAVGPIANPIEMGNTHEVAVKAVGSIEGYRIQFERIFEDQAVTIENIGRAIATFERAIVTGPAPYDYLERILAIESQWADELEDLEEEDPELFAEYNEAKAKIAGLSESAKRGRELFFSDRANCTACHAGANFSDEQYHNLGVGMEADEPDLGRFTVTKLPIDRGAFKTPTIRNVALTAPFMHDGSQETLEEVVEWYVKGGHPNPFLSEKVKKLELTEQEKKDLVAFMDEGLTGAFPPVEEGRLP